MACVEESVEVRPTPPTAVGGCKSQQTRLAFLQSNLSTIMWQKRPSETLKRRSQRCRARLAVMLVPVGVLVHKFFLSLQTPPTKCADYEREGKRWLFPHNKVVMICGDVRNI